MTAGLLTALIAGLVARAMFTRERPGIFLALLAGFIGALVGSPIAHRLSGEHGFHAFQPESFIAALTGAVILLWLQQRLCRRGRPRERRIFS